MSEFSIDGAMKAVTWERAKCALRELVALQGEYFNMTDDEGARYELIQARVESFIEDFQGNGFHE